MKQIIPILLIISLAASFKFLEDMPKNPGKNADIDCTNTEELLKFPQQVLFCAKEILYNKPAIMPDSDIVHKEFFGNIEMTRYSKLQTVKWPYYPKDHPQEDIDIEPFQWFHKVRVYAPKDPAVTPKTAFVYIDGGSNLPKNGEEKNSDDQQNGSDSEDTTWAYAAEALGAVFIQIEDIPNQPIYIEGNYYSEDGIIAYTWRKFLQNAEKYTYYPLHIPMSVAVWEVNQFVQEKLNKQGYQIEDFVVAGASKRGWTTWLNSILDEKVRASVPIVIDILNVLIQFDDIRSNYAGNWPWALKDYNFWGITALDNFQGIHLRNLDLLMKINDPLEYRFTNVERLSIPKYIVNASGDDFFIPIGSHRYYRSLPNPQHNFLKYVGDTGHDMQEGIKIVLPIVKFFKTVIQDEPQFPHFEENTYIQENGNLKLVVDYICPGDCDGEQVEFQLWQAKNTIARDFRFNCMVQYIAQNPLTSNLVGVYKKTVLPKSQDGNVFQGEVMLEIPKKGWQASFVKVKYAKTFSITTQIYIQEGETITPHSIMPQQDDLKLCSVIQTNYDMPLS